MMRLLRNLYLFAFALFCLQPIMVIVLVSITASNTLSFPPKSFSLRWFAEVFTNQEWRIAFGNSVTIASGSSVLAVLIALPVSYAAWRHGLRYARSLLAVGVVPFMLPPVLIALGFLLLFSATGFYGSFVTGIVAHAAFLLAIPLVIISLGLESAEKDLLEAASTMGATERQMFITVILPLALPYVLASFAFCIVLSLNEYVVLLMTIGFTYETLPIKVFNAMRYGYSPVLASIAVLFLAINTIVFGLVAAFGNLPKLLGALDND